jgi:SulP family sulfate permease
LFGALRLGKFIRMVPYPVMLGFVNGLAIVIFLAQFDHFKSGGGWMAQDQLLVMASLIAVTMAIIYVLPKFTRAVPPALVAILVVAGMVAGFGIETKTVGDMGSIAGGLPQWHIPAVPLTVETLYIILPYSLILAGIGLIESLLTLNLIDAITDTRGRPNRESLAQVQRTSLPASFRPWAAAR